MPEQQPLVSVIMLARNEENHIEAALRSVLEQTVQDLEVIVVDGLSTDRTPELVRAIAAADPRIRLVSNPQRTIPHGLNLGLAAARGRYASRCDSHAVLNDRYLAVATEVLQAEPTIGSVGGRRLGTASSPSGVAVATALSSRFGVGDALYHYSDQACDLDHATFGVVRVELLRSVGGWDERLLVNEDVDLDYRIRGAGYRIRFEPRMIVYWQVRESLVEFRHQYRRYGRGKAAMVVKNGPRAVRLRHLVPPALVLALAVAVVLLVTGPAWVAVVLAGPYLVALLGVTAVTAARPHPVPRIVSPPRPTTTGPGTPAGAAPDADTADSGSRRIEIRPRRVPPLRLAGAFLAMHLSWGAGFLEGLLLRRRPADASARERQLQTG